MPEYIICTIIFAWLNCYCNLYKDNAVAVYEIPGSKQLTNAAGNLLYIFNSYSDVHIDTEVYYTYSEKNWKNALKYATDMNTDLLFLLVMQ